NGHIAPHRRRLCQFVPAQAAYVIETTAGEPVRIDHRDAIVDPSVAVVVIDVDAVVDDDRLIASAEAPAAVPRVKYLAGRQGNPADIAEADANRPAAAAAIAEESDQRWSPRLIEVAVARIPAPAVGGVI